MANFPKVLQPKNYKRNLFPHQLTSIYYMEKLEDAKRNNIGNLYKIDTKIGIQGDITGYGKTISMIGLILRDKMKWDISEEYINSQNIMTNTHYNITRRTKHHKINTNLIIAGQSIIPQWRDELKLTNLKFEIIRTKKKSYEIDCENNDVIICSPTMYNILQNRYKNYTWKRIIYDEPGSIHIPNMKEILFGFLWFITATADYIRIRYSGRGRHFISSLNLNYIENIFFQSLIIKNEDKYVLQSWDMPETQHIYYDCYQPISETTQGLVSNRIQKLIDAGNIKGAILNLGGKQSDNIIDLIKLRFEEDLLEANHKIEKYTNRINEELLNEWKNKKEIITNKINKLHERYKLLLNSMCTICHESIEKPVILSCCNNIFCGKCIMKWYEKNRTCPLCRESIQVKNLLYLDNQSDNKKKGKALKTKIEQIVDIINSKEEKGKFIIFSEEDITFSLIINKLKEENMECKEVKGKTQYREKIIKNFKNDKLSILFLNSKNNGAGIDLQECTDIILYHKMQPNIQTQIIGRANRIGRKNKLFVHHLCIQNTL